MGAEEIRYIVIATEHQGSALLTVANEAISCNELEIRYSIRFSRDVEYLLRFLRKGFGWMEYDRGQKEVTNPICIFNKNSRCSNTNLNNNQKCTNAVRGCCNKYKSKYTTGMLVNYVRIEKAGQIRNM